MQRNLIRHACWGTCLLFAVGCTGCAPGKSGQAGNKKAEEREAKLGYAGTGTGVLSVIVSSLGESDSTLDDSGMYSSSGWSSVQAFSLDMGTGALALDAMTALGAPCPGTATTTTTGQFYLLPDVCTNQLTVAHLALTGQQPDGDASSTLGVEEISESPYPTDSAPLAVRSNNSGKFAYVLNHDGNSVGVYKAESLTGRLTLVANQPALYAPRAMAIHPSGHHVYVAGGDGGRAIAVFSADPMTGLLSKQALVYLHDDARALLTRRFTDPVTGASRTMLYAVTRSAVERFGISREFDMPRWLQAVRLPSDDQQAAALTKPGYLYVANRASIVALAMNPEDGSLAPVQGSPFRADTVDIDLWYTDGCQDWPSETGPATLSVATGLSGRFLFVSNRETMTLSSYAIDADLGTIAPLPWSPRRLGSRPTSVVVVGGAQT